MKRLSFCPRPSLLPLLALLFSLMANSTSVLAQLETRGSFPVLPSPNSIAVGDFNHDGKLDLAVACLLGTTQITILLGNGDGTFQPAVNYAVGSTPYSVATADFNHDGNLDLAVANSGSDSISILLGNGDGTFQAAQNINLSGSPKFIAVGDFNGDHKPDLVTVDPPSISVLLGNGDGTFQAPVNTPQPSTTPVIGLGDFNRDGKLDLAAAAQSGFGSQVVILLGNGDGTFQTGASYTTGAAPNSVGVADLRNDGKLDLAIAGFSGVSVLLGNGDGTFQAAVDYSAYFAVSITVADFNGDGKLDLAVADLTLPSGIDILLGNGDGTFQTGMFYPDVTDASFVAVGDFNGDRKVDIVAADNLDQEVTVLLNTGTVSFTPSGPVNFPFQLVGTRSSRQTVTLTNSGTSTLTISSMKAAGQFRMSSSCGGSVLPGGSCTVNVTFSPRTQGPKSGTVSIIDSASSKPQVIELTGAGTVVGLSPAQLNFPPSKVGKSSAPLTVQVKNHGSVPLTFSNIYVNGANYKDFSQTSNCLSQTLNEGMSCTVTVTFTPAKTGSRSAYVGIVDTGGGSPQTVSLTGTGT
jgi:FG-GAP-like repeat/Abnormal spindle-like microcephaly-assoc'd, ASPM-SPD-2-Hydin